MIALEERFTNTFARNCRCKFSVSFLCKRAMNADFPAGLGSSNDAAYYDGASPLRRHGLAKASTIAEVKPSRTPAEAAEIYAKRRQLGEEAEHLAYKIKILALATRTTFRQMRSRSTLSEARRYRETMR